MLPPFYFIRSEAFSMSAALIPPKLDTKKKIVWLITLVIPAINLIIPVT